MAQMLISEGADTECLDSSGSTPLAAAAEGGHMDVVKLLAAAHAKAVAQPAAAPASGARKPKKRTAGGGAAAAGGVRTPGRGKVGSAVGTPARAGGSKKSTPARGGGGGGGGGRPSRLPQPRNPSRATSAAAARRGSGGGAGRQGVGAPSLSTGSNRKPGYVAEALDRLFGAGGGLDAGHAQRITVGASIFLDFLLDFCSTFALFCSTFIRNLTTMCFPGMPPLRDCVFVLFLVVCSVPSNGP